MNPSAVCFVQYIPPQYLSLTCLPQNVVCIDITSQLTKWNSF